MSDHSSGYEYAQPVRWTGRPTEGVYQAGPWYGEPYRPLQSLSGPQAIALTGAALVALLDVVYTLGFWAVSGEYREAASEGRAALDVLTWADALAVPFWGAIVFAYVGTGIWLARARANSIALTGDPSAHRRRKVWVWLGWWVPIVLLWFPFQVVRDVLNESSGGRKHAALLGWWWTCWLLWVCLGRFSERLLTSTTPLTDSAVTEIGVFLALTSTTAVIGVVLWWRIVLNISSGQRELAASRP